MKYLTTNKRDALTLTAPGPNNRGQLSVTVPVKARVVELSADQVLTFGACIDSLIANGVLLVAS